jgi:hypothetical protein
MGESFSFQLSTGEASLHIPFSLPNGRGAAQAELGLSYSSASGHGIAGQGWSVGASFIARQTDRGPPRYQDPAAGAAWHPKQDRFVFDGGQELVPICLVTANSCSGAREGETMPFWANGWQYFRARIEGAFQRFFWSPDHLTWRVQDKDGTTMELGVPLDGSGRRDAVEVNPANGSQIYRWNVAREYDAQLEAAPPPGQDPRPVNVVAYRYLTSPDGEAFLLDIYDTPPRINAASAPTSQYSHRVHLTYETRPDTLTSFRRGWRTTGTLRVRKVDITSKPFVGGSLNAERELVRRYHLAYDSNSHISLLTSIVVEGRCASPISESTLATQDSPQCATLPAMTMEYQRVAPYDVNGDVSASDLPGFEGFDERIRSFGASSPQFGVDEALTDLFDINSDGLPDVLVTAPGLFGGKHGVYFNGEGGNVDTFGSARTMGVAGVAGADEGTITLKNPNVAPLDVDGDGIIDLLHMPTVKTYAVYTPRFLSGQWVLSGRTITTASQQDAKIDFTNKSPDTKVVDVDGDGLVDVVYSSGTEYQTFFSLGRYPNGDGQFGHATWTGASSADLSNDPVTACVPSSGTPVRLSDPDVMLADMNGDGYTDIVRVRPGDIRYWPGRGNGFWGTGDRDDCVANTFGQDRDIAMTSSPQFGEVEGSSLLLDDVTGDGLPDLVEVRNTDVDIYINVDGVTWTTRHVIRNSPPHPASSNRVRLVDVNGSGTRDVLWGDGRNYQYMDLSGGEHPWLLSRFSNGLGKTTDLAYSTSTKQMLSAELEGQPWQSKAPSPMVVVESSVESDNLTALGRAPTVYRTEFKYRDPVYDGRQREFRGFRTAAEKHIGDENSPTVIQESTFLLG